MRRLFSFSTTARTSPAATCWPVVTLTVTVPADGAVTECCIFMASSTRTTSPASTSSPSATATLTTVPGIGASRLPLATASAGSVKRGTSRSRTRPRAESTSTARPPVTAGDVQHVVASAVRSRASRASGPAASTATPSTTNPSRVPNHSRPEASCSRRLNVVRCGWRRDVAPGDGDRPAGRYARRASRSARASGSGDRPTTAPDWSRSSGRGCHSASIAVVTSPARNAAVGRISTRWSRLVMTPWIRARRRAETSWRIACRRVGRPGDDLGEHRVVVGATTSLPDSKPESTRTPRLGLLDGPKDARPGCQRDQATRLRLVSGRVLGVEPHLDRVARGRWSSRRARAESRPRPSATPAAARRGRRRARASVTGCSTWSRVFISRKKNRSVSGS